MWWEVSGSVGASQHHLIHCHREFRINIRMLTVNIDIISCIT